MSDSLDDLKEKTQKTAELYFKALPENARLSLAVFDKELAREISMFYTEALRPEKIPHKTRQLVTVAALTVLERTRN